MFLSLKSFFMHFFLEHSQNYTIYNFYPIFFHLYWVNIFHVIANDDVQFLMVRKISHEVNLLFNKSIFLGRDLLTIQRSGRCSYPPSVQIPSFAYIQSNEGF